MGQETGKPLSKEDSVQELLGILVQFQEKGLFDSLMETVNHVQDMERTVAKMEDQIKDMNRELSEVKKQNEHLVKKADETVRDRLAERVSEAEKKVAYVKMKLSGFKEKIREKCRQVVSGVKAQGKRALNGMAGFLRLREGVERLKGVTEKMAGSLDALSESVEQEREISMQRKADKTMKGTEKPEQIELAPKPYFTYQDEVQDFMGQAVAENRSYGSGADAFDAFMAYREGKGTKEQTGAVGRTAMQQPLIPAVGQTR